MSRRLPPEQRLEPGFGPRPGQPPAGSGLTAGERIAPVESTIDRGDAGWFGVVVFLLVAGAAGVAYWWWWTGRPLPWEDPKPAPAAVAPPAPIPAPAPQPGPAPQPVQPTPQAAPAQPAPPAGAPAAAVPATPLAPPPAPSVARRQQAQQAAPALPADVPPADRRADGYCRDVQIEPAPGSKVTVPLQRRMCWDAKAQAWTTTAVP